MFFRGNEFLFQRVAVVVCYVGFFCMKFFVKEIGRVALLEVGYSCGDGVVVIVLYIVLQNVLYDLGDVDL